MKIFSLLLIVLFGVVGCNKNCTNDLFKEALRNDSLGNYEKSIELYDNILKMDSSDYASLVNRGRARINNKDINGINDIEKAANNFPNDDTYLNLAAAYIYLNIKTDLVIAILRKAEKYNSENYKIYLTYAGFYSMIQNNNDSIIKYASKVVYMQKKYSPTYHYLENAYLQNCDYNNLISICDTILKYEPQYAYGYNNRGFAKFKMGDVNGALIDIDKSLELDSKNSYAYKNKGIIELFKNDTHEACKNFKKAKQLGYAENYGGEVDSLLFINCDE